VRLERRVIQAARDWMDAKQSYSRKGLADAEFALEMSLISLGMIPRGWRRRD
jgi:hypothetical protein